MAVDDSSLRREMADLVEDSRRRIGDEAERVLSGHTSAWPTKTGVSKRSWIHITGGAIVRLINYAPYSIFVEFSKRATTYPRLPACPSACLLYTSPSPRDS